MNKHRSHQIDESAQRILTEFLPATWNANEQVKDYAKDYLVEIGDDNGNLTGQAFYVQLKGQEKAKIVPGRSSVKYPLESKYAAYYSERITDLPIFLVVVDINARVGWWLFLQPILEGDQRWRKQKTIMMYLPTKNKLGDKRNFRAAIEEAKKWMRLHHPTSIQDAVSAHKDRIENTDPRFSATVTLVDNEPRFNLSAKEEVPLEFIFNGRRKSIEKKVTELFDKGVLVSFLPGEVKVKGSPLFDQVAESGCSIQASIEFPGTVSLVCKDDKDNEISRLGDIPGLFSGGRKELTFAGGLHNSPLSVSLAPIGVGIGGEAKFNVDFRRWDGQRVSELAYFERLNEFFQAIPKSASTSVECYRDGNLMVSASLPLQEQYFAVPFSIYLQALRKCRAIAKSFSINPNWSVDAFDRETRENASEIYAVLFEDGCTKRKPNVRLTADCVREGFRFDVVRNAKKPGLVTITSQCTYELLGAKIELGRLVHEYSDMAIKILTKRAEQKSGDDTLKVSFLGSKETVMRVRQEKDANMEPGSLPNLIAGMSNMTFAG